MKRIEIRILVASAVILLVAIVLMAAVIASPVEAGGGGYCNPLSLKLGGCQPRVTCNIGRPIIDYDVYADAYILKCQQDPTAPESGNPALLELAGLIGGRNEQ